MATSTFNMITGRERPNADAEVGVGGDEDVSRFAHARIPELVHRLGPQGGGGSFNFTDAIDAHGDYVVWMLDDDARSR